MQKFYSLDEVNILDNIQYTSSKDIFLSVVLVDIARTHLLTTWDSMLARISEGITHY